MKRKEIIKMLDEQKNNYDEMARNEYFKIGLDYERGKIEMKDVIELNRAVCRLHTIQTETIETLIQKISG